MRSVQTDERAQASSQISLSPYRNVTAALFCRVPVCVFSGKTLVAFKPNSRSQSQLVFLQVCFYLVHFLILCARSGLGCNHNEPTDTSREVSMRAATKVSMKDNSTDAAATRVGRLYTPHSLSAEREENTITRPMTPLVFRFLFIWLCPVVWPEKRRGKTQKFQKIKTGAILKRDDQVITLLFQCLLVGLFSQQKNRKRENPTNILMFWKGRKTRAHVSSQCTNTSRYISSYI